MHNDELASILNDFMASNEPESDSIAILRSVLTELRNPSRSDYLMNSAESKVLRSVLHAQARLRLEDPDLSRICLDSLTPKVSDMTGTEIESLLADMVELKLRHDTLLNRIVFLIPVIPYSNVELDSVTNALQALGAGSKDDQEFLVNLVRFRNVVVLD